MAYQMDRLSVNSGSSVQMGSKQLVLQHTEDPMSAGPKQLVFGKTAKRGRAARTGGPYSPFADLYLWSYLFKKVPYHACSGMLRTVLHIAMTARREPLRHDLLLSLSATRRPAFLLINWKVERTIPIYSRPNIFFICHTSNISLTLCSSSDKSK